MAQERGSDSPSDDFADDASDSHQCAGRKRALLVGIRVCKSEDYSKTSNAHEDVYKMRDLLLEAYHYSPSEITVIVDDGIEGHVQPTRHNILLAIADLVKDVKAGDQLCFHYVGHAFKRLNSSIEEDDMDESLIPLDGEETMIVDHDLHRALIQPLPASSQLVAILDTCCSSTILAFRHPWRGSFFQRISRPEGPVPCASSYNQEGISRADAHTETFSSSTSPKYITHLPVYSVFHHIRGPALHPPITRPPFHRLRMIPRHQALISIGFSLKSPFDVTVRYSWRSVTVGVAVATAYLQGDSPCGEEGQCSMSSLLIDLLRENPFRPLKDVLLHISHATYSSALKRHNGLAMYKKEHRAHAAQLLKRIKQLEDGKITSSLFPPAPPPSANARSATLPLAHTRLNRNEKHWLVQVVADQLSSLRELLRSLQQHERQDLAYDVDAFQNPQLSSARPLDMNQPWRM
ncbi:Metacaspase type II [Favolaschia claudopus]|uniref:Metacaspase type II n=1 Tax=Favolaschia claudopus TaxID=2862362 RepID=A0AAW0AZS7_9AGAR